MPGSLSPLVARDLVHGYGDRIVLSGVDLVATPGVPLGLVGENGAGKSTLLRLLAGVEHPDSGSVRRPLDLGYLAQEPDLPRDATVGTLLDDALAPLHSMVERLSRLADRLGTSEGRAGRLDEEYDEVLAWATAHEAWDADRRARTSAARLGLSDLPRDRPVASLSGGQRSRLALAALITRRPDCLLLDEPTNHLDDEAMELLEDFVVDLPGVVVAASHDRVFLQSVCGTILDLDPAHLGTDGNGGDRFSGGYVQYLQAKREARRRWQEAYERHREELDTLREAARTSAREVAHGRAPRDNDKFIHAFKGANVARAVSRRVADVRRRIEVLERRPVPRPPEPLRFGGLVGPARPVTGPVVEVRDLTVRHRLQVPRLDLEQRQRLLVTGANGSGKSTLLRVLAGRVAVTSGTVVVRARRVGHLPQDVTFRHPDASAIEVYDAATGSAVPLRDLGLLRGRDLARPVGELSVGQQRRLGLAVLVGREADLLLLDEPTNHISLVLAEELEDALSRPPATVVVASHDRWLRRRWTGPVLALAPVSPCAR